MIDAGVRAVALELVRSGESAKEAARRLGIHPSTVARWAKVAGMVLQMGHLGGIAEAAERRRLPDSRPQRGPRPGPVDDYLDGNGRLTAAGRMLIAIRLNERRNYAQIAAELGVHRSTVTREVAAGSVDGHYRSRHAQARADRDRRRPRARKLDKGTDLRQEVITRLNAKQSPEQISGRLRREFPDRPEMHVSHETIYQALYVQGAGSLRRELAVVKALRTGRTSRRPRSDLPARRVRAWIGDAVIANRPAEVADRAVPGHWEGDLVISSWTPSSALITLVERNTRFVMISRVDTRDSTTVTDQLTQMTARLPASLWRSLTWDQGVEMAQHARFSIATGCPVYFCDPHSPWQRPSNENSNGLIRDFFPKGTDFTAITDAEITEAEHLLNTRPRKVLDYATPAERLDQLLAVAPTP